MTNKAKPEDSTASAEMRDPQLGQAQARARNEQGRRRIGIVQCITNLDDAALRYLILSMNSVQTCFQFEFVPFDNEDVFLEPLLTKGRTQRPSSFSMLEFHQRERRHFEQMADRYELHDQAPDYFQVISVASFSDSYFQTSSGPISVIATQGYSDLVPELRRLLSRKWLGSPADPASPAGIVSKLGHNLFITKGLQPSPLESARMTLAKEGVKQVWTVIGTVIAAVLAAVFLAILGYAAVNVHVTSPGPQPGTTKPAATRTQPTSTGSGAHS